MFPPHHQLANLITLVDLNGQRALGYKQDVLNLSPLADRWRAFGWDVHDVHGHDAAELAMAIADLDTTSGPPHVLIVHTTFGKGVSFMENQLEWHYWPLSAAEYQQALLEIDAAL
jgi:transketolase